MNEPSEFLEDLKKKRKTRPIDRFYRCFLQDQQNGKLGYQCRGINHDQFRAGDRLSNNFQRAFLYCSWNIGEPSISFSMYRGSKIDSQLQAMFDHSRIYYRLSTDTRKIVKHVCLDELPIREFEAAQYPKMRKGRGMVLLRDGLDELAEIYRMG